MFTAGTDLVSTSAALSARMPAGGTVAVVLAEFSWQALEIAQDKITSEIPRLKEHGVSVDEVGVSARMNRVLVYVTSDLDVARDRFAEYGPTVVVLDAIEGVQDACTPSHCPLAKSGLKVLHGEGCTMGPIARRTNGLIAVTAGHCFHFNGGSGQTWTHNGDIAGTSSGNTWANEANADMAYFVLDNGFLPGSDNAIIVTANGSSGPDTVGEVVGYLLSPAQIEGSAICRTGAYRAGVAKMSCKTNPCPDTCPSTNCAWIEHQWVVDFDSTGGDSGGPYYTPPNLYDEVLVFGTHTHSTPNDITLKRGWYSPTDWIIRTSEAVLTTPVDYFCTNTAYTRPTCSTYVCS